MSGSVNKVILVGNLGADPEVRSLSDGSPVVNLSVATNRRWTDRASGERRERTEWHRVVIFDEKLTEIAQNYLRKGSKVYVEGELQTRKWTDNQGAERYTTEVVLARFRGQMTMLDSRAESEALGGPAAGGPAAGGPGPAVGGPGPAAGGPEAGGPAPGPPAAGGGADLDDDIPF